MRKLLLPVIIIAMFLFLLLLKAQAQTYDEGKKKIIYLAPPPEAEVLTEKDQRDILGLLQELEIRRRESAMYQRFLVQEEMMQKERDQLKAEAIRLAQERQKFAEDQLTKAKDEANTYKQLYEALIKQQKRSKGCTFYKIVTLWLGRC